MAVCSYGKTPFCSRIARERRTRLGSGLCQSGQRAEDPLTASPAMGIQVALDGRRGRSAEDFVGRPTEGSSSALLGITDAGRIGMDAPGPK